MQAMKDMPCHASLAAVWIGPMARIWGSEFRALQRVWVGFSV